MADDQKVGGEVREQAADNSFFNTEPAVARGAVIAVVGAIATLGVVAGVLDPGQKEALEENAGTIAVAALVILPILQAVWTRINLLIPGTYSPRSAAKIAVANAAKPENASPTLDPPP